MQWMAWTLPTALFFGFIGVSLVTLTVLEIRRPTVPARGWLPMVTTRGDRFFISLLLSAWIHMIWLATLDIHLAGATVLSLIVAVLTLRWG